ncbi:2-deoxy-D-gluconate 3-dehydrogenase [Leifsonia sp. 98AMF]|uniref:SDR family oxidoreductase n=1 Tax=unclassified Leifsonia TaxID=2663824 RepID=UPI00087C18B7|nr:MULTISPECIES: SDR family oxidoreductase [unclassified Leifsonia]SDH04196.1 2-deoxy-D-gluconate 3-dehydrogenase [Leifsonia sp. 197AMF]SDJ36788.1 2-deoxy-D-gluconate 3-dehydrogenase [Leifsonia sp. 466MF]SDK42624.1 2-deoxy-D-gluconate 3-dehydrogenase [Leifsonia sp. 157MF]SDN57087.1 2-deoxy-D-gluconate 3-dehydrogenase [Leifsonia sp. 509MF]SEN52499.1 2-deoxy-D-gluconate 3-dehydrogenase [Leifsonia sp. 467MF]
MSGFDLSGRLAVVTGAKRGIGFAIAEALAAAGADIVGVSATLDPESSAIGDRVRSLGRSFEGHRVDFADRAQVSAFAAELAARDRHADILVNNAGTIRRAPAAEHPLEWFDEVLEVDLTSGFVLSQALGGRMLEAGGGRVVFTASLLSFQGGITVPGYAAAKSGVAGLVRALSNEWAGRGVTVNGIAPGYIATDNTQALQDDPDRSRSILERIPAGRWGTPEDIGGAAVFLASDAARYVSGAILPVDGGWLGR